jgi:DNA-binding transcriptional ArsR family regulator
LLREQERTGRTDAIRELAASRCTLDGVGINVLMRHTGRSRNTIRRQLDVLEEMGLVRVVRPPVLMIRGSDGRLIRKTGGREKPVRIIVTANPDVHGKPRRRAGSYGQPLTGSKAPEGGSYGQPLIPFQKSNTSELPPLAGTDGIGAALAEEGAGRQEAAEEGGQEAAGAGGLTAASLEEGRQSEPVPLEDTMEVLTEEILANRKGWPTPSDPAHVAKQAPRKAWSNWGKQEEPPPPPKRWLDDYVVAPYRRPGMAHKAASAPEAPPTPLAPPAASEATAEGNNFAAWEQDKPEDNFAAWGPPGAQAESELADLIRGRRRDAADAASDRFRHEWRRDRGLPTATVIPPSGRPLDPDAAMLAEIVGRKAAELGIAR